MWVWLGSKVQGPEDPHPSVPPGVAKVQGPEDPHPSVPPGVAKVQGPEDPHPSIPQGWQRCKDHKVPYPNEPNSIPTNKVYNIFYVNIYSIQWEDLSDKPTNIHHHHKGEAGKHPQQTNRWAVKTPLTNQQTSSIITSVSWKTPSINTNRVSTIITRVSWKSTWNKSQLSPQRWAGKHLEDKPKGELENILKKPTRSSCISKGVDNIEDQPFHVLWPNEGQRSQWSAWYIKGIQNWTQGIQNWTQYWRQRSQEVPGMSRVSRTGPRAIQNWTQYWRERSHHEVHGTSRSYPELDPGYPELDPTLARHRSQCRDPSSHTTRIVWWSLPHPMWLSLGHILVGWPSDSQEDPFPGNQCEE